MRLDLHPVSLGNKLSSMITDKAVLIPCTDLKSASARSGMLVSM